MKPGLHPEPFRLSTFGVFLLATAVAACTMPLLDTPYQRITKAQPQKRAYHVRVVAALEQDPAYLPVVSPREPTPAQVREAVCEGLSSTRFRCVDEGNPASVADYVVRVGYFVVEEPLPPSERLLALSLITRGKFGEDDPAQDANHSLQWWLSAHRPGEQQPFFRSERHRDRIDFWPFEVRYWVERYFSE